MDIKKEKGSWLTIPAEAGPKIEQSTVSGIERVKSLLLFFTPFFGLCCLSVVGVQFISPVVICFTRSEKDPRSSEMELKSSLCD